MSATLSIGDRVVVSGPEFGSRQGVVTNVDASGRSQADANSIDVMSPTLSIRFDGDKWPSVFWESPGALPWDGLPSSGKFCNVSITALP